MRALGIMILSLAPAWVGALPAEGEQPVRPLPQGLSSSHFLETLVGLAVVLLLIFAIAFALRRFGRIPGTGKGQVQLLGGVSVGTRERAVLVSVEGQRLLLGVAPGSVRTLHVLPAKMEGQAFEQQLSTARGEVGQ